MHATDSPSEVPARKGPWGWIVLAVIAAGALGYVVVATAPSRQPSGTQNPAVGRKVQFLRLQPLTGDAKTVLADDLQGHVSIVNYWGTWCGPCIREFPELVAMADELSANDSFRFYPVSCGSQGNDQDLDELRDLTEQFLQARDASLATYADQNADSRRRLALLLGMDQFAYPTTMLVDRNGRIQGFWVGYNPAYVSEMRTLASQLLSRAEDEPAS